MIRAIKSRLLMGILLIMISVFLIILGLVLTITIIFSIAGIPLLALGAVLLVSSILFMFIGTFSDLISFLKKPFRKGQKSDENVIELKKKGRVYERG